MKFFTNASNPIKSSPRYAIIAASFRAHGLEVRDDEYEVIDALCDGTLPRPHPRYFADVPKEVLAQIAA